jgi:hypothetical protein
MEPLDNQQPDEALPGVPQQPETPPRPEAEAQPAAKPAMPASQPSPQPAEHRMTIQNGPWTEEVVFQNGQAVRTEYPTDELGREIIPPWQRAQEQTNGVLAQVGSQLGISADDMSAVIGQAQLMTPRPAMTGNPKLDSVAMRQYTSQLDKNSRTAMAHLYAQQRQAAMQEQVNLRQQRYLESREKEAEARMSPIMRLQKQAGITPDRFAKMIADEEAVIAESDKDVDWFTVGNAQWAGPAKKLPPDIRQQLATQRVYERLKLAVEGFSAPAQAAPSQPQPAAPAMNDKQKAALKKLDEAINRMQ